MHKVAANIANKKGFILWRFPAFPTQSPSYRIAGLEAIGLQDLANQPPVPGKPSKQAAGYGHTRH